MEIFNEYQFGFDFSINDKFTHSADALSYSIQQLQKKIGAKLESNIKRNSLPYIPVWAIGRSVVLNLSDEIIKASLIDFRKEYLNDPVPSGWMLVASEIPKKLKEINKYGLIPKYQKE